MALGQTVTLTKAEARRFLLAHQRLWPPRQLSRKSGIVDFIGHVGCIQFDPINVVGRNPDLVLQSRVAGYRPEMLTELLYSERRLWDGWDKMAAIYLATDWPYFTRHRAKMRRQHGHPTNPPMAIAPEVLRTIRRRGPLSSLDLKHDDTIDWSWGQTSRLGRAALDILYAMGQLGIHHRVGSRRVFDLIERLLPAHLLDSSDPNQTDEDYQDWHVLRRVGGLGLADAGDPTYWGGIHGVKSRVRRATLARLVERGELTAVTMAEIPGRTFFIRTSDLSTLEAVQTKKPPRPQVAIIAPLDNLIWDRRLVRWLFDFDYTWEVYKPAAKRRYGYYVLPVLYGDRFVARFEPSFDKKTRSLTITNWWWEAGVQPDAAMRAALVTGFRDFLDYLDAAQIQLGDKVQGKETLSWMASCPRTP